MGAEATQLLCTFTTEDELGLTIQKIVKNYSIAFDTIYILQNLDTPCGLCCTYNILQDAIVGPEIPAATISLHRKKTTNTLYTINALNLLVAGLNGGKIDKKFPIPWEQFKNTILVTAYGKLKIISTRLDKIIKVSEI